MRYLKPLHLAPTLFVCGLLAGAVPLTAQGSPPPARPHEEGPRPGFDPVVLLGPPEPGAFRDLLHLDDAQAEGYGKLYDGLMDDTRAQRDSLRHFRESMRRQHQGGERGEGPPREQVRGMVERLERRQREFDESLRTLLTAPQYERYQAWRTERRRDGGERMHPRGDPGSR